MRLIILLIFSSVQILVGCSSGGGDGGSQPPANPNIIIPIEPPDVGGGPYSLYSGSLKAIDLTDPSKTYLLSNMSNFEGEVLVAGQMNAGGTAIINLKEDRAIFYHENKFWTLDLNQGSELVSHQLTSFVGVVCDMEISGSFLNLDESLLFFQTPGMDNMCSTGGDDLIYMTPLDADFSTAAVDVTSKLSSVGHREFIYNSSDPSIIDNILIVNNNQLVLHNADLSDNGIVKHTATSSMGFLDTGGVPNANGIFIEADGNIYFYDYTSASLGAALHTVTVGYHVTHIHDERMHCNAAECVFGEQNNSSLNFSVYKIPADGSGQSTLLANSTGNVYQLSDIRITNATAYLELKNTVTTDWELQAIPLSGGTLTGVAVGDDLPFRTMEDFLYYTLVTDLPNNRINFTSYALQDGSSTPTEYQNSLWIGGAATEFVIGEMEEPNKILLASNYTSDDTRLDGATLRVFDSKTHVETGPNLGSIVGTDIMWGEITGVGDKIIGLVTTPPDPELYSDLIYVDFSQTDSYQRITNDLTTQEGPILLFYEY